MQRPSSGSVYRTYLLKLSCLYKTNTNILKKSSCVLPSSGLCGFSTAEQEQTHQHRHGRKVVFSRTTDRNKFPLLPVRFYLTDWRPTETSPWCWKDLLWRGKMTDCCKIVDNTAESKRDSADVRCHSKAAVWFPQIWQAPSQVVPSLIQCAWASSRTCSKLFNWSSSTLGSPIMLWDYAEYKLNKGAQLS